MSTSRMQDELFDLHEINAGIVARQKAAITALEAILADHFDREEMDDAFAIEDVIAILNGAT